MNELLEDIALRQQMKEALFQRGPPVTPEAMFVL